MVQIAGKYKLEKNENLVAYLTGLGIPEDKAKIADSVKPEVEIIIEGDNITITSNSGIGNSSSKFVVGKEVDDPMPMGVVLKSTTKLESDAIIVDSKDPNGVSGQRVYKFTSSGFVLTMTSNKNGVPSATRTYSRC
ncbi:unnamed protein product [Brassicogethes aeneus]|uniref:Uncharacterized protein n=1 Tax=Brassicogethes aeneus TaxID=1431903 RepID=A0A9P0BDG3_BRAAE|nr:unnamed protein product [Brassicogethes aeneus]